MQWSRPSFFFGHNGFSRAVPEAENKRTTWPFFGLKGRKALSSLQAWQLRDLVGWESIPVCVPMLLWLSVLQSLSWMDTRPKGSEAHPTEALSLQALPSLTFSSSEEMQIYSPLILNRNRSWGKSEKSCAFPCYYPLLPQMSGDDTFWFPCVIETSRETLK